MSNKSLLLCFVGVLLGVGAVLGLHPQRTIPVENPRTGSLAEIPSPSFQVNGLTHWFSRLPLTAPTTTPCAIVSPPATSTLVHAALQVSTGSTTATTWTVAKSANAFATTSQLGVFSLGSGLLGTMTASSTQFSGVAVGTDSLNVIAPNQYIVWSYAGAVAGDSTKFNGVCSAEFIQI